MQILIISEKLLPMPGNNANIISKLIPYLSEEHEVRMVAPANEKDELPKSVFGVPVYWVTDTERDLMRRFVYPALSKAVDPNGYSDALSEMILLREIKKIRRSFEFDAVLSISQPFTSALASTRLGGVKKILYIMDPPEFITGAGDTPFRNRKWKDVLSSQDAVITTPFIRQALNEHGCERFDGRVSTVGFPIIEEHRQSGTHIINTNSGKINLLFSGWMYSDIRSPKYFLNIVSRLDERFCIYFMGKECDKLRERFDFETRAEVVTLPQQPYDTAIDAMFDADILINIGNSVPVHMPSKTLEYINTGKPMVNFYKFIDCPTKYYTDRYPLSLNLFEGDEDIDGAADRFRDFCLENRGKTVRRGFIDCEFADCTPKYIAQQILEKLGDGK